MKDSVAVPFLAPPVEIVPAHPDDAPAVGALLVAAGLSLDGIDAGAVGGVLVARAGGRLAGTVTVERFGTWGYLRSLAVAEAWRGQGLGQRLVAAAEADARAAGVERLALLSSTAAAWFAARGYTPVERARLPGPLQQHPQVAGACPVQAASLVRPLG